MLILGEVDVKIRRCTLRHISLPLRHPMRTSYGTHVDKHAILVVLETLQGSTGVAECVAMIEPTYTEETIMTAWHVLNDFLVPSLRNVSIESPQEIRAWLDTVQQIRGNQMAKAGLEMALWDALSAEKQLPLHTLLGGMVRDVPVGISLGMSDSTTNLLQQASDAWADGYRRIKLKIAPGCDFGPLSAIRQAVPDLPLMADANSAYHPSDAHALRKLDDLGLSMIEQPLGYDDVVDHAELQQLMRTPICLDESIRSAADARLALQLGATKVINLKPGRVGGFHSSLQIHDVAMSAGCGLWCGGMYETGVGRLHNLSLLSLPGFNLPTDNGPSNRYFVHDIVTPGVSFAKPGLLRVESLCGVAQRVDWQRVEACTIAVNTQHITS